MHSHYIISDHNVHLMMYILLHFYLWHWSIQYYIMLMHGSESLQNLASNNIYIIPFIFLALLHPILYNANSRFRISSKIGIWWYISPHFYFWHCSVLYYIMLMQDPESPQKSASDDVYITSFLFLALLPCILCNASARSRISSKIGLWWYRYHPIFIFGTAPSCIM